MLEFFILITVFVVGCVTGIISEKTSIIHFVKKDGFYKFSNDNITYIVKKEK